MGIVEPTPPQDIQTSALLLLPTTQSSKKRQQQEKVHWTLLLSTDAMQDEHPHFDKKSRVSSEEVEETIAPHKSNAVALHSKNNNSNNKKRKLHVIQKVLNVYSSPSPVGAGANETDSAQLPQLPILSPGSKLSKRRRVNLSTSARKKVVPPFSLILW